MKFIRVKFLTLILFTNAILLIGQVPYSVNQIQYSSTLNNVLFTKTDSIKDKIWLDSGLPYYNMPINSKCFTSGDFGEDTLVFCDCFKKHDTIYISLSAPSACCCHILTLQLIGKSFTSNFFCSYDISPSNVTMHPIKSNLVLKQSTTNPNDLLEGYVSFNGEGKYNLSATFRKLTRQEKNSIFKQQVQGYFKCKVK
jgi:hypothetical protein